MPKYKFATLILVILLPGLVVGCTLPIPQPPEEFSPDTNYTAAVLTIAAQLTDVVGSITDEPSLLETSPDISPGATEDLSGNAAPTETFPYTSTPLPTKTPLPSITSTIEWTPTFTPQPSIDPSDPKSQLGAPDYQDTFNANSGWAIYDDEHVDMQIGGGKFTLVALIPGSYEAMLLREPKLDNFYLEATTTTGDCLIGDRYGLLVRAPGFSPIQTYVIGFTCDGRFSIRTFTNNRFNVLVDWTNSAHINRGSNSTNVMGILAEGSKISLFANGNPLIEVEDETFTSGYFGVFIGSEKTPNFTVQITEIAYWNLP